MKKIRIKEGISQERLADKIGVNRTYISLVENGTRNPSLKMIYRIAKELKVKSTELLSF